MTMTLPLASFVSGLLGFAMLSVSLFLILLILVQRGRGGGLTGALGGPGGQSAFGTKAGDLFTRITSFVALGWISLCAFTMWMLGPKPTQMIAPGPAVSAAPTEENAAALSDIINLGDAVAPAPAATDTPGPSIELTPANVDAPAAEPASVDIPASEPATPEENKAE